MDHGYYFLRPKICNFMPVYGSLELSAASYGNNINSTKYWTPQLLFLVSCVHSKIGFLLSFSLDFVLANLHDIHCTKQGTQNSIILLSHLNQGIISFKPAAHFFLDLCMVKD